MILYHEKLNDFVIKILLTIIVFIVFLNISPIIRDILFIFFTIDYILLYY
jgi:hypothetical protein